MNEKILEIARQAGIIMYSRIDINSLEKFAELLIKDYEKEKKEKEEKDEK